MQRRSMHCWESARVAARGCIRLREMRGSQLAIAARYATQKAVVPAADIQRSTWASRSETCCRIIARISRSEGSIRIEGAGARSRFRSRRTTGLDLQVPNRIVHGQSLHSNESSVEPGQSPC